MRLGTRQECIGSSPRVSGVCQDGAREFARRRLRLTRRLSGLAEKLIGRDSPKGSGKLVGNTLGDRQKKIERLIARMREAIGLGVVRSCVVIIES
ncbi:hypothetical protein BHM03_00030793 [Ensete ventricosum]|nr:hypothetical protein BHM03_00030793 [Ensete ventricosum]